jgi:hypothetical protein
MTKYERKLQREGAFLMLTHGEGYSTDDGAAVPRRAAEAMTNSDLFGENFVVQRKGEMALVGNDDGLFAGHSQTWRHVK